MPVVLAEVRTVFESFSEDPTLSGQMASDYVKGLQGNGVSAVIKHFVANDQEHERTGYNDGGRGHSEDNRTSPVSGA